MKRLALLLLVVATNALAQLHSPSPQVLVPAAGALAGENGTFFRSDMAIFNYRNDFQTVLLQWFPRGVSGAGGPSVQIRLNPLSGIISQDFVTDILHQTGLGAIRVSAVGGDGIAVDPAGRLVVTARIWTPQPGSNGGAVSQTFPTIATSEINTVAPAILGQRISDQYRTNVGIVNFSAAEVTFDVLQNSDVETFAPIVQQVTVPPFSMQQVAAQNFPSSALQIRVTPRSAIAANQWIAYGSSVDNVTGDSWSSLGMTVNP